MGADGASFGGRPTGSAGLPGASGFAASSEPLEPKAISVLAGRRMGAIAPPEPKPIIVCFMARICSLCGPCFSGAAARIGALARSTVPASAASASIRTMKVWEHFGQRILRPAAGTRRSST